jgi:hypothetical protein
MCSLHDTPVPAERVSGLAHILMLPKLLCNVASSTNNMCCLAMANPIPCEPLARHSQTGTEERGRTEHHIPLARLNGNIEYNIICSMCGKAPYASGCKRYMHITSMRSCQRPTASCNKNEQADHPGTMISRCHNYVVLC